MRIVFTGSRVADESWVSRHLANYRHADAIGVGDARGADAIVRSFFKDHLNLTVYKADWEAYGRLAGPIRNAKMLDDIKPDLVVGFLCYGAGNRGTQNCLAAAGFRSIPVEEYWGNRTSSMGPS